MRKATRSWTCRTIAIGDIHSCSAALDALLDAIRPRPEETIVNPFASDFKQPPKVLWPTCHALMASNGCISMIRLSSRLSR